MNHNFPLQYLSWYDCADLLETFEANVSGLSQEVQLSLVESLIKHLSHASGIGKPRPTASYVVARAVHDMILMIGNARTASVTPTKRKLEDTPDELGGGVMLGPNLLEKMKGGNPAGDACKDFLKGRCPRAKCSFSHAKKPKKPPQNPVDETAEGGE